MRNYRSELEQEVSDHSSLVPPFSAGARKLFSFSSCKKKIVQVKELQRQLQEEIELHVALAEAVTQNAARALSSSSVKIPHEVQELYRVLFIFYDPASQMHLLILLYDLPLGD